MEYAIHGSTMQAVVLTLQSGESVITETGGMAWQTGNVKMDTTMPGGLFGGLKRKFTGESFFMTTYEAREANCQVAFTPFAPGKVIPVQLGGGRDVIVQRDAFMVAESTVDLELHFQRSLGTMLFGGEGFILQRLSGQGLAFAEVPGEVVEYDLAPGQQIRVDPGHVAMFDSSVRFDIERVKGVRNMIFGGEGLFLASLQGPGHVWLQTMTLSNLAAKLASYMPQAKGQGGGDGNGIGSLFGQQ